MELKNFFLRKIEKVRGMRRKIPFDYDYKIPKNGLIETDKKYSLITDDVLNSDSELLGKPINEFDFKLYSKAIANIINNTKPKYTIGIYGNWGMGKTTLMKMIEYDLKPPIFKWNTKNLDNKELEKLISYLRSNFDNINWLDNKHNQENISKTADQILFSDNYSNITNLIRLKLDKNLKKSTLSINETKVYDFYIEEINDNITDDIFVIRENTILTVWFNAWKYENEENFALIPLMKTIAFTVQEHLAYKNLKDILLKGVAVISKELVSNIFTNYLLFSSGSIDNIDNKLKKKLQNLPEIDKDNIYFDGMRKIEIEIQKIMKKHKNTKIVVFIDDLDRCKPEKAREIFESIKIFLDIDGFVFVLGLSRETLDKLLEKWLEDIGLKGISAQDYIQKIIQIEINIPKWHKEAIYILISNMIKQNNLLDIIANNESNSDSSSALDINDENKDYTKIINLLIKTVDQNPRQTKRLLNNFILAKTANNKIDGITYFLQEVIKKKKNFFESINSPSNRNYLKTFLNKIENRVERINALEVIKTKKSPSIDEKFLLEIDNEIWELIDDNYYKKYFDSLLNNWDVYKIASELVSEQSSSANKINDTYPTSLAITSDDTRIVSGSLDNTIKVWDLFSGRLLKTFMSHTNSVISVKITSDNTRIVSGAYDNTIKVWDLVSGRLLNTLQDPTGSVFSVAITSDNTRIVSGSVDHTIKVWDLVSGRLLNTLQDHTGNVVSLAITSDNSSIVSGSLDHTIKVWDLVSGRLLNTLQDPTGSVFSVAITSDNTRIVSGSVDHTIKIWDLVSGRLLNTLQDHTNSVTSVAITSDNTRIVSGSFDSTIKVWDLVSGRLLNTLQGHTDDIISLAITSDNTKIVSGSVDHTIKVWDLLSGRLLMTLTS